MRRLAVFVALLAAACTKERGQTVSALSDDPPPRVVAEPSRPALPAPAPPPSSSVSSSAAPQVAGSLRFVEVPKDAELGAFLRSERLRAKSEGRVLVLYAGASWCPPCRRFHAAARSHSLDALLGRVTLVVFDADADVERLSALGYTFKYIPYFARPGPNGRRAASLEVSDMGPQGQEQIMTTLHAWQQEGEP